MSNITSFLWPFSQLQLQYLISHQVGFPFKLYPIIITSCPTTQVQALMTSSMYFRSSQLIAYTQPSSPCCHPTMASSMHFSWMMLLKPSFIIWSPCSDLLSGSHCLEWTFLTLTLDNLCHGWANRGCWTPWSYLNKFEYIKLCEFFWGVKVYSFHQIPPPQKSITVLEVKV